MKFQSHFRTIFVFALFLVFASPLSISAQSDGMAPRPDTSAPSASDAGGVPLPAETTTPLGASPRTAPATTSAAASPAPVPTPPTAETSPQDPVSSLPELTPPNEVAPVPESFPTPRTEFAAPEDPVPFPYVLASFGIAILLVPYGMYRLLRDTKSKKPKDSQDGRCDDIKKLLERKRSTLAAVSETLALKEALIEFLSKKIEEKKEEMLEKTRHEVIDATVGEDAGEIIQRAEEVKKEYDTFVENIERAKAAVLYFKERRRRLHDEIVSIEPAYHTCVLGSAIFEGSSRLGRGLEIFEMSLQQKLYRYTAQKKDLLSPEVLSGKQEALAKEWLLRPKLPEGEYQFFLTEKGKGEYERNLLPLQKKDFSDISCEEKELSEIDGIVYEDEWCIVAKGL